jgi:hypothetical protein
MAGQFEIPLFAPGCFKAGAASLAAKQFYFVKLDSAGDIVVCAAATDVPIGILQNAPGVGEACEVMMAGISKVSSDAALTIGDQIGTSADGQADAKTVGTDTTEYVVGRVLVASGAAAELATVAFSCLAPHRAA